MLERLIGWFRFLWDAGNTLESHSESFKELRQSDDDVLEIVHVLAVQNQQLRDELRHERELRQTEVAALRRELAQIQENLELRFRLELSEALRQLPPKAD